MIKKKETKTSKKSGTPSGAAAAEHKAEAAKKSAVKEMTEKIQTAEPKAAAVIEPPKAKIAEAVKKAPAAAQPAKQESAPAAAPAAAKKIQAPEAAKEAAPAEEPAEPAAEKSQAAAPAPEAACTSPRRSVVFIGSECYPFVKTGGLGDVMYALPKALVKQNCDVKVILPRYKCIPAEYQNKMIYRGSFEMDLCADGRSFYVGIMEYVWDGVVYDFIDNEEFFSSGNPYISLIDDIPKYCYFAKAALAALNYMDWVPDIIHCHDWQAEIGRAHV